MSDSTSGESVPSPEQLARKHLVLVSGAGRSGTSTIAGTLHHLGLHVPLPVIKPNESNPLGFFESTWPLWFHRRLMETAFIEQTDGRPEAVTRMAGVVTPEVRQELHDWLAEVAGVADEIVVKDPRSIWVPWLWQETAAGLGVDAGFLTMLRHPAEVLGSRSTYYSGYRPHMDAWEFAVMNLCGWINGNLVVESQTRGRPRAFLLYDDLLDDWRPELRRVRDTFGLTFNDDLEPGHRHAVDDFIDPGLRRHEPSWDGLDMPEDLVQIADGIFDACCRIAHGEDPDKAEAELDTIGARYAELMRISQAIAWDGLLSHEKIGRRKGAAAAAEENDKALAAALRDVDAARANVARAREELRVARLERVPASMRAYRSARRRARNAAERWSRKTPG
ncbi:MAG: hypothetical protein JWR35_1531 [Marmoricola sp.]|nr:hypothetical protein [Marmoricola sp.]